MKRHRTALGLAALLVTTGVTHFVMPTLYDAMVPRALPGKPRTWTYASGAAELAVATAVAIPKTRRLGGLAAAALFVSVLPANIQMAMDWRNRPMPYQIGAFARLPLQIPLISWALRIARR